MPMSLRLALLLPIAVVTFAAAAMMPSPAAAEGDDFEGRSSYGIAYVYGIEAMDLEFASDDPDEANGVTAWLAYRWNERIASTVRGEYLNGFQFPVAGDDVRTQFAHATFGIKAYPLGGRTDVIGNFVEPFVEVSGGLAWGAIDFNGNGNFKEFGFIGRFAGGVDVNVTDHLGLVIGVAWNQPTGELQDLTHYTASAGLQYSY